MTNIGRKNALRLALTDAPTPGGLNDSLGPAFDRAPVAMIAVSLLDSGLRAINPKARVLLEIADDSELQIGADRFFAEEKALRPLLSATERVGEVLELEVRMRTLRGHAFWARLDSSRIDDLALVAIQDVGAYKHENEALRGLAERDSLTGLPNRRSYAENAQLAVRRARALGNSLCLAIFDVDLFKRVNDEHGHQVGDRVLQMLAHVAQETLRRSDFVARFGGEEFVIVMPSTSSEEARKVLERLRGKIREIAVPSSNGVDVRVSISIGLSEMRGDDSEVNLLERADRGLYRAKSSGRDRVCFE